MRDWRRWTTMLLLVLPLAWGSVPVHARVIPPLEGVELARQAFAGVTDFSAEITQEKQITLMKKKMVSTGIVRFRRPDAFFMEIVAPHPSRLLLKNNRLNLVLLDQGIHQKTELPPDQGLLHWLALLNKPMTSLPAGMAVKAEREGDTVQLTIQPAPGGAVREMQIVLREDGRPQRLSIEERNRDRTVINFRKVRKNMGLQDKDFRVE